MSESRHELPHTRGCIVCGRDNPHGLKLSLHVDEASGAVTCDFVPRREHVGFEGIIHGGVLATVLDEAMVWAASWSARRFCVCGELTTRFRQSAAVGESLHVEAKVTSSRARLIGTEATVHGSQGTLLVTASGKYVPVPPDRNRAFVATLIHEPTTRVTAEALRRNI